MLSNYAAHGERDGFGLVAISARLQRAKIILD
jgi:hypothetical protein